MSTRLLSTTLAAAIALGMTAGGAFARNAAPPNIPTAAAVGASASPLVGQGYLPSAGSREDDVPTGSLRLERRHDGWHPVR